jgi:hypothetical protein
MTLSPTSRVFSKKRPSRLGTYLATAVGSCGLASSADADIVTIDVSTISGVNGGVANGNAILFNLTPNGQVIISNNWATEGSTLSGFRGYGSLDLASSTGFATPIKYSYGASISDGEQFSKNDSYSLFSRGATKSPDFGPNSYMGFRVGSGSNYNLGWIEVTWNGTDFEIKSAAYESTLNTPILAGVTAVPEPSTGALAALVLGGAALGVARRRRKQEAAATSEQAV